MGATRLAPTEMWFAAEVSGDRTDITIFIRGGQNANSDAIKHAGYLLLDNALGEYVVETAIGVIEFSQLPEGSLAPGLRPFIELPAFMGVVRQSYPTVLADDRFSASRR